MVAISIASTIAEEFLNKRIVEGPLTYIAVLRGNQDVTEGDSSTPST